MAHPVEPMDIDNIDSDFDNKENTFHHNNVQPCTEKGYEELDVSELNMRLRYSVTPAASPMSKSYTSYVDNKSIDSDDSLNITVNDNNLTRSLNTTITKNDSVVKSLKSLPLQSLPTEQLVERNPSVLRQLDSTITDNNNITVTVSGTNDIDENLSLPSSSSSAVPTPEATTPTKEIPKSDGGSPIMRGLKSVLNMFRSSQSPIPSADHENNTPKQLTPTPTKRLSSETRDKTENKPVLASTPISSHRDRDANGSKRNSPLKDSITFNDDLEKELQWKDETTILFSQEKIPIHKLFYQQKQTKVENKTSELNDNFDTTVEYMDISYNESNIKDRTMTEVEQEITKNDIHVANESDSEFLDCETESNATKTGVVDNKTVELIKEQPIGVHEPAINVTFSQENQELHQYIDKAKRGPLNTTVPLATGAHEESIENTSFTSINQNDSIALSNKSTLENVIKTEDSINITKESNNNAQQIKTGEEKLESNSEHNLDVTMTMDNQENKNKSINNILEVSTLESHTKSLSSLIESLDGTKSFDERKANIGANNTFNVNATFNKDAINLEASYLQIQATDIASEIPNAVSSTTTENCIEVSNVLERDTSKQTKDIVCNPIQNLDVTMTMDKQEEAMSTSRLYSLENIGDAVLNNESAKDVMMPMPIAMVQSIQDTSTHEASQMLDKTQTLEIAPTVQDGTFNISKNITNEEIAMIISNIQTAQEVANQEALQTVDKTIGVEPTPINESPADAPLPEDDDIDKDQDIPTDTDVIPIDNATSKLDNRKEETKDSITAENTNITFSEKEPNDKQLPDMLIGTKDIINENEIKIPDQVDIIPGKEEITKNENFSLEVGIVPESQQENQNTTVVNEVKSIDTTFEVQTTIINSVDNTQILPDIVTQPVNGSANFTLEAPDSQTINDTIEINNKESHQSSNCKNEETNIQSNIESTISPENQMDISMSVCEEILDKNREISEMFLTEQKIDKLQHASDVALSYEEIKSISLSESKNSNPNEMLTGINITPEAAHDPAINIHDTIHMQDSDKTVTLEEQLKVTSNEEKILLEQEKSNTEVIQTEKVILNENKIANITVTSEEDAKINAIEICNIEQEIVQKEGNHILNLDKIDELNSNLTTMIEDITMTLDEHKDVAIHRTSTTNLEDQIKTMENGKENEKDILPLNLNDGLPENAVEVVAEDEVIVSGNNNPYVSVAADLDKITEEKPLESFEEIGNPFDTKSSIPSSPPITSKGYNFNFDEIDDPFATKVKIRMSPPLDSPNKTIETKDEEAILPKAEPLKKDVNKNRRRSQPARQKLSNTKKALNVTVDGSVSVSVSNKNQVQINDNTKQISEVKEEKQVLPVNPPNDTVASIKISSDIEQKVPVIRTVDVVDADLTSNITLTEDKLNDISVREENKYSLESVTATTTEIKTTSSLEQSTYYSAGTSSNDSTKSRNVFNLPEIDDMNFNPFATKSKVRQSPPRDVNMDNPFATKSKVMNSPDSSMIVQGTSDKVVNTTINIENNCTEKHLEDKMETEPMEKDSSGNISNSTNSSKATDKDVTIREVNTEDEDTIEGPFLEAEDIEEKQSDFDSENVDMMQFNDLPAPEHDENAEGELFIDAEAFEFLLNQNKSNVVADSGKESLFLKFDPLFAKRMSSDSVVAALSRAQKRQSTPTRTPRQQRSLPKSVAGPSAMNLTFEADPITAAEPAEDVNTTVTKPMMVVTPAVNPTATLRKSVTPTRSNRRSITFTSPAMAVIDRLLSLSANNSFAEQEAVPQVSREQNEADLALTQLREVLAEKEIHVYNLRSESKELKDRLATLESQMKLLETEGQARLKKINDLNDKLSEKTQMNKSMAVVVEEYERTIASLIAETEQDKKRHAEERIALMNERDEQTAHLASMEVSFNDLHSKYEKSKQVIMNYKANEESYKQSLKEFEENVSKMQKNYELLKQHATSKLNHANDELQKLNRSHEAEVLKLNAMIKRKDLHITSLEETLAQKTKANEELTAICDELINKVG